MVMDKRKNFRFNQSTLDKIQKIMEIDNVNYPNESSVVRAGIYYLYNKKLGGLKKNEK